MESALPSKSDGPRRVLVIYNPTAGRSRPSHFEGVVSQLQRLGCDVTVRETTRRGDAETFARHSTLSSIDAVVAAGGDGTIAEVLNGLMGPSGPQNKIPLGIIPLGTANVLAAEIGLPSRPEDIAAVIAAGTRLCCHPGQANGNFFLMMAGVGFDAHVVDTTSSRLKKVFGKGAYAYATVRQLLRPPPGPYKVIIQGVAYCAASVVVGKGHFYAGRFVCTPDARLDKPLFQVCLFHDGGAWATLKYLFGFLTKRLPHMANVTLIQTDQLRIEGRPGDPAQGDGDIFARLPLDIHIAHMTLEILVPA